MLSVDVSKDTNTICTWIDGCLASRHRPETQPVGVFLITMHPFGLGLAFGLRVWGLEFWVPITSWNLTCGL